MSECQRSYEKKTNADHIRSMTDKELAEFISRVKARACLSLSLNDRASYEMLCDLNWLRQVDEDSQKLRF